MNTNNLVSVIIPAYNHEKYVQETIQSIINQTYKNIELIIINDGSKDSTWEKINEMKSLCEQRFCRVLFESQENQGTCITLNKLINHCKGDYIYLIASDDIAKPKAIEKEYNFLSSHKDYALCVGNNEFIDQNSIRCYWGKEKIFVYKKSKAKYRTFGEYLQKENRINFLSEEFGKYNKLYFRNYIPNGYLIRKSIFNKIGPFTPEAPLEDYWMMLQISKYAKMKYINEILFSYRWHNSNTVKNKEKMKQLTLKTKQYENMLLEKTDLDTVSPNVKETLIYGRCNIKIGIPNYFEICTFKRKEPKKVKNLVFKFKNKIVFAIEYENKIK